MVLTKSERFKQWRGAKADAEMQFINAAHCVDFYIKKIELSQIKQDVYNDEANWSAPYRSIQQFYRPSKGILVSLKLDIDEALELSSTAAEKKIFSALQHYLHFLYENYKYKPAESAHNLITNFHDFLQLNYAEHSDKKSAKKIYLMLYLTLNLINKTLNNLPSPIAWLAKWYKIDTKEIHSSVKALIKQIEDKIMMFNDDVIAQVKLDAQSATHGKSSDATVAQALAATSSSFKEKSADASAPVTDTVVSDLTVTVEENGHDDLVLITEAPSLTTEQQAIQNYFNQRVCLLLTDETLAKSDAKEKKLGDLVAIFKGVTAKLNQYVDIRAKESLLVQQIRLISVTMEAFKANDTYIIGRMYFLELMDKYSPAFKLLMEKSSGAKKDALVENIKQQQDNIGNRSDKYVITTILSPLTVVGRLGGLLLPDGWKNPVLNRLPDTLDSKGKALFNELAADVLAALNLELAATKIKNSEIHTELAEGNNDLFVRVGKESSASLLEIAKVNAVLPALDALAALLPKTDADKGVSDSEVDPLAYKTRIQDCFQQRYVALLQSDGDESEKISALARYMKIKETDLNRLIELRIQKDGLVDKIKQLSEVHSIFSKNTANTVMAPLASKRILELRAKLAPVNAALSTVVNKLAVGNQDLANRLIKVSLDELRELVTAHAVGDNVQALLLAVVTGPIAEPFIDESKTAQEYFNEQHIALLNNDLAEEDDRLNNVVEKIVKTERSLKNLLTVREEKSVLAKKAQQIGTIVAELESNKSNQLLVNLAKDRLKSLQDSMQIVDQKIEAIARQLSGGKAAFKQVLLTATPASLAKVIEANHAAIECIEQYKGLKEQAAILSRIQNGTSVLNQYVTENTTWWVRFTNFLAQFCSIFKSNAGIMIDRANLLKQQLALCKVECEQEISAHIAEIQLEPNLGNELLGDLPEQHAYEPVAEKGSFNKERTLNLLAEVSIFKPKSSVAGTKEEPVYELEHEMGYPSHC